MPHLNSVQEPHVATVEKGLNSHVLDEVRKEGCPEPPTNSKLIIFLE